MVAYKDAILGLVAILQFFMYCREAWPFRNGTVDCSTWSLCYQAWAMLLETSPTCLQDERRRWIGSVRRLALILKQVMPWCDPQQRLQVAAVGNHYEPYTRNKRWPSSWSLYRMCWSGIHSFRSSRLLVYALQCCTIPSNTNAYSIPRYPSLISYKSHIVISCRIV